VKRTRKRGRKGMSLSTAGLILAALAVVASAWWLLLHVLILAGVAVMVGGTFYVGRRYERRRAAPSHPAAPKPRAVPAPNPAADQIAHLEHLAARPIEAIIASYERVAGYHRSQP